MKTYSKTLKDLYKKYGKENIIIKDIRYVSINERELVYQIKSDKCLSYYNYVGIKW